MIKKIGIPRALSYYQFYLLYKTFFEELGAEVVVSDATSRKILDQGVKICVDEACLPVKLFHGHVMYLKDKVDYLFIPRLTSISENEYICPKFGGLPDMVRNTIDGLPEIIDVEINLRKRSKNIYKSAFEIGGIFTNNKKKIRAALNKAMKIYRDYCTHMQEGALASDILDKKFAVIRKQEKDMLNIVLIGHAYNIYDKFINMDTVNKLRKENVNIITIDMIDDDVINANAEELHKSMFWYFGRKAVGGVMDIIKREDIDGIIYMMAFGCGVDSFICDMVQRRVRSAGNIPFITITLDEHSGEAGMDTRLEAFIDMIKWRKKDESYIPAHG